MLLRFTVMQLSKLNSRISKKWKLLVRLLWQRKLAEGQKNRENFRSIFLEFLHELQWSYLPKHFRSVVNAVFVTVRKEEGRRWAKASKTTGGTLWACEGIIYVSLCINQRKQLTKYLCKKLLFDLINACTLSLLLTLDISKIGSPSVEMQISWPFIQLPPSSPLSELMVEAEDLKSFCQWSWCCSGVYALVKKNLPPAVLTAHTEEQLFSDDDEPPTKTGNLYKI